MWNFGCASGKTGTEVYDLDLERERERPALALAVVRDCEWKSADAKGRSGLRGAELARDKGGLQAVKRASMCWLRFRLPDKDSFHTTITSANHITPTLLAPTLRPRRLVRPYHRLNEPYPPPRARKDDPHRPFLSTSDFRIRLSSSSSSSSYRHYHHHYHHYYDHNLRLKFHNTAPNAHGHSRRKKKYGKSTSGKRSGKGGLSKISMDGKEGVLGKKSPVRSSMRRNGFLS